MAELSPAGPEDKKLVDGTGPRKRRWHSKVPTGCLKCKERRVKCDGSKPGCQRCSKIGVQCPGYRIPVPRIFELPTGPRFDSDIDKANYDYFVHIGSALLSTFQLNSTPFWTRIAPQIGETDPAVRHGLIALGTIQAPLHRSTVKDLALAPNRRPELDPGAMVHISKAMHLLSTADPATLSVEVALTSCVLFLAAEIWVEKTSYSHVHILAAHRILRDNLPKVDMSGSRKNEIVNVYLPMIDELIVQACTFADDFPPPTAGIPPFYKLHFGLDKVHAILNWKDALDGMISLLRCVLRVTSDPVFYTVGKAEVAGALDRFAEKLVELQATGSPPSDGLTEEEEYLHLRLHHRVATIMLHTLAEEDETVHDSYIPDFLLVLERCENIIDRRASLPEEDLPNIRGPTLGILPPLFFVATKCRNHTIRHRALKLLHGTLLNEREWTSCMATMMAKFVVEQEEKLNGIMPGDEPDLVKVRLRLHDVDFSSSKHTMHLGYFLHVDGRPREHCSVTLPYMSHPSVEINGVNTLMSRKTLRACGYSSIILFTPPIDCHCLDHNEPCVCPIEKIT